MFFFDMTLQQISNALHLFADIVLALKLGPHIFNDVLLYIF